MKTNINICHLTSVHKRNDVRIFEKECKSLAKNNFDVSLIVADGQGNNTVENIKIYDIGKELSRLKRFTKTTKKIYKKAIELNCDLYHFHDPELIFVGIKLLKKEKKVIYDIHEDVPRQILSKPYLNSFSQKFISRFFEKFENRKAEKFSALCCATPHIRDRFSIINKNSVDINNFPKLDEFQNIEVEWENRVSEVCYIGSISVVRGIKEIVKSFENQNIKLHIAGDFVSKELENEVKSMKGWQNVIFHGFVGRKKISDILSKVKIGLVTLHPTNAYKMAYPVKMFEYMAAGVPVLASNFDLYNQIVSDAKCGEVVNPLDPEEIAKSIKKMLENDNLLKEMSTNGKIAVNNQFNWQNEETKLIKLYENLL